jgi:hypothetical protein
MMLKKGKTKQVRIFSNDMIKNYAGIHKVIYNVYLINILLLVFYLTLYILT